MKRNYGVMDSVPPEWPDRGQSKTREVFEIYPGLALQGPPLLLLFLPRHFYFYFLFFVPSTENAISFSGCHRFQRSGPRGCECIYLLRTKHSRNYSVLIPVSLCRVRRHWQLEKKKRRRSGVNGALSHPLLFPDCRAFPQKGGSEHDVWSIHKFPSLYKVSTPYYGAYTLYAWSFINSPINVKNKSAAI